MFLARAVPGCSRFINHEQIICLTPRNPLQSGRRAGCGVRGHGADNFDSDRNAFDYVPVAFRLSSSSFTEGGDTIASSGVRDRGGGGVDPRSAESRLELPVAAGVDAGGGVLQCLVSANACVWNKNTMLLGANHSLLLPRCDHNSYRWASPCAKLSNFPKAPLQLCFQTLICILVFRTGNNCDIQGVLLPSAHRKNIT